MKIATWNVNSIRTRLEHVVDWLNQNSVDVLCLQETKVVDADFPVKPFEDTGYNLYKYGQKSYNGVALISRKPLDNVSTGFQGILPDIETNWDDQKRVITGTLEGVRIVNLYVPNGSAIGSEKYEYKLKWLKILQTYLSIVLEKSPDICMCGDFNIALEDRDIHENSRNNNHIMASDAERQALRDILDLGFADAFRKFTTEGENYSWWDYRAASFPRNKGWRIDHHYLTPELYQQAKSCTIDVAPRKLTKPSDHAPVIVEF
ncbi:exodeoxyribonuclease III [Mastigocoleus sp. MO_188.B34]|uniref:exodeoxyribonuclease III n=1 Tax=Mastigocoleus sp. MO_188.B34 TaxID=3036635 RepID=UPI00261279B9|nr:exodeoxyribonuclease III [Mastigocoleus sp. MO_188.B34]MDJ0697903.1 exodeoxyribonuclease III [Mastigocoleus sp. MO_188.B34]